MSDNPFDGFFDAELAKALDEVEKSGFGPYEEIPEGIYLMNFEDLKYGTSQNGNPKATFRFRVVGGTYDDRVVFHTVTFSLKSAKSKAFGIHNFRTLLKDMMVFDEVPRFESPEDFDKVTKRLEEIDFEVLLYRVKFGKDGKGYQIFSIEDVESV